MAKNHNMIRSLIRDYSAEFGTGRLVADIIMIPAVIVICVIIGVIA